MARREWGELVGTNKHLCEQKNESLCTNKIPL
jgi:hypothetical protein